MAMVVLFTVRYQEQQTIRLANMGLVVGVATHSDVRCLMKRMSSCARCTDSFEHVRPMDQF